MKLISENIHQSECIIEQKSNGEKEYFIEGIFLQAEIKNRNGRVYPMKTMEKEFNRYNEEFIKTNRALGELCHPEGPTINLDRVSHLIVDMWQEGTNFHGRAKLLDTPMGNIAKRLMDEGVQLAVSSRGMGTIKNVKGTSVVQEDFYLATAADIVADPSAQQAFVKNIIESVGDGVQIDGMDESSFINGILEGKEWVCENGVFKESGILLDEDSLIENFENLLKTL